jgi:hypothetical protein
MAGTSPAMADDAAPVDGSERNCHCDEPKGRHTTFVWTASPSSSAVAARQSL